MERETKLVEVTMPLHTHFETPDINGRIFTKDAFKEALEKANSVYKDFGGIPVVLGGEPQSMYEATHVDIAKIIGIANNINIETMTGDIKLDPRNENAKITIAEIENGMKLSFGIRGVGTVKLENGSTICDVDRIISFQLIDTDQNPCEDNSIFINNPDNNEIVKQMGEEIRKQCQNYAYNFKGDDQKEIRRQYDETLQKCATDWNKNHPGKEVELKLIYDEEKCDRKHIEASLSITGPGAAEFKAYLNEEDNISI